MLHEAVEEITNANQIDYYVNDKSSKIACYKLFWLSIGNWKKKKLLFTRIDLSLSLLINFNQTGQKKNLLPYILFL